MSNRWQGGFIQAYFDPLTVGPETPFGLYSWGDGNQGGSGQGDIVDRSSPVQIGSQVVWQEISASFFASSLAITTTGSLWAWGRNDYGQLAQNNIVYTSSPVQVGALNTWSYVSIGGFQTLALKTDGTLWAWGFNTYGSVGNSSVANVSSPVQIGAGTDWATIATGGYHSLATKNDGTLWAWGYNATGQLGQNNVAYASSPTQVGALTTWSKVAGGFNHTLALKTDGTLWAWGSNSSGQLGQNNIVDKSSPVQVGALTTWNTLGTGEEHTVVIKTDGTLWTWGRGDQGELGLNASGFYARVSSPTQVGAETNWSYVNRGENNTFSIKTDGTLWVWGDNDAGELGLGDVTLRSSPVQVGSDSWQKVVGAKHTLGLR